MNDPKRGGDVPLHPQERNLRERSPETSHTFDNENTPEPVSFDDEEAETIIEDEDLDRVERDMPKDDDMDDIKDS